MIQYLISNRYKEEFMKIFLGLSLLLMSFSLMALPTAVVKRVKGRVFFNDKLLKKGDEINKSGKLTTKKSSFVKISIKEWENTISLGPNSLMKLNLLDKQVEKKYSFIKGACRWISKLDKSKKSKGVIYTPTAALGVRGTDFIVKANDMFQETEIIVLDGMVNFDNLGDGQDSKLINKGQWGGLGGRFGGNIGNVIDLPENILSFYRKVLKL